MHEVNTQKWYFNSFPALNSQSALKNGHVILFFVDIMSINYLSRLARDWNRIAFEKVQDFSMLHVTTTAGTLLGAKRQREKNISLKGREEMKGRAM